MDEPRELGGAGCFEKALRAENVGAEEWRSIFDATVHVSLGGKIHKSVESALENVRYRGGIADVTTNEVVARVRREIAEALGISGVRELIEIYDADVAAGGKNVPNKIRPDKTCSPSHQKFQGNSPFKGSTRSTANAMGGLLVCIAGMPRRDPASGDFVGSGFRNHV